MMLMMMLAIVGIAVGIAFAGSALAGRRPPALWARSDDRRLIEQAERIEMLEEELRRVRDQADFTERLLAERSGLDDGDAPATDVSEHPIGT